MAQEWYWMQGRQKQGPIETAGLRELARNGRLQPTDLIWREGMPDWVRAAQAKGLFPDQTSVPTGRPAPTMAPPAPGIPIVLGKRLNVDIAKEFVAGHLDDDYLAQFTAIDDAAAATLSQYNESLFLDGLASLSCAAAKALGQHNGALTLNKLMSLSDEAAVGLKNQNGTLELNGLTSLSSKAATALGQHEGGVLSLNGLRALSDEAARALAQHKGRRLDLNGLKSLPVSVAEALAQQQGGLLLNGLTSLPDDAARALAQHSASFLHLNGLPGLSVEAAKALARHSGDLEFNGLATLSVEVAEALAQHKGDLMLDGLPSVSDAVARALGQHKGDLWLEGLTALSDEAARSLAKHNGPIELNSRLKHLSADASRMLASNPHIHGLEQVPEQPQIAQGNWNGENSHPLISSASGRASGSQEPEGAEPCCNYCKHRLPRNTCGHRGSPFSGKLVDPKGNCGQFSENPAYRYYVDALSGIAGGKDSAETAIGRLEAAIDGGLPKDDEVLARRFLAPAYLDVAYERTPGESVLGNRLFYEALKQLEYAVGVDCEQGYGIFSDPLHKAMLVRFDACYGMQSNVLEKTRGPEVAIAYLEEKLSLYGRVPGDPMVVMLGNLGVLYYNDRRDRQRAMACFQRIVNSQPSPGSEEDQEHIDSVKDGARKHLITMGEQPSAPTANAEMSTSSPQERIRLIKRIIVNVIFLIPYIMFLGTNGGNGNIGAGICMLVPMLIWGFIGFRWLLRALNSITGLIIFARLGTWGWAFLFGSFLCSAFGAIIIPILIVLESIQLWRTCGTNKAIGVVAIAIPVISLVALMIACALVRSTTQGRPGGNSNPQGVLGSRTNNGGGPAVRSGNPNEAAVHGEPLVPQILLPPPGVGAERPVPPEVSRPERIRQQMEKSLTDKGYRFHLAGEGLIGCYCEIGNCIWACGAINGHLGVVFSDDGGQSYKVLHEFERPGIMANPQIVFTDKTKGFCAYDSIISGDGFRLFETNDGGSTWKQILSSEKMGLMVPRIRGIKAGDKHICAEGECLGDKWNIESYDGGVSWASWLYVDGKRKNAESRDGGKTWQVAGERPKTGAKPSLGGDDVGVAPT